MDTATAREIAAIKTDADRHTMDAYIRREVFLARGRAASRALVREFKRAHKHAGYARNGLNGARAVARRRRQRETDHSDQRPGYVS